jgi:hypothetical protein
VSLHLLKRGPGDFVPQQDGAKGRNRLLMKFTDFIHHERVRINCRLEDTIVNPEAAIMAKS